ncbi:MAG TPA: class II aldolase/adducin family protein [Actinophytocola sp.]|jgi:ribulose-5-phosphate 4-epimerase/fuculose-1-phosphate aldolase|nr:class II aldolase/adducin family protein [Actinophytocola sp.]
MTSPEDLAATVATACRVLAATGLVEHVLGHVSVRSGDEVLVRCRGPREAGLAYTTAADVRPVPLDLSPGPAAPGEWSPPQELPIHTAILRARPEATAVVHAHPPAVVAMSLAGLPWRPIFGAYDIPAARLAADGIPVWPRAALVSTPALGAELAAFAGDRPVAVLRGHGLVSVATGPPHEAIARAVVQAFAVNTLASMTLAVCAAGGEPAAIPDEDLAALPDLGPAFNVDTMWRHLCARAGVTTQ